MCTACFDQCKETAEQCLEVGSGAARLRHAYERAFFLITRLIPLPLQTCLPSRTNKHLGLR